MISQKMKNHWIPEYKVLQNFKDKFYKRTKELKKVSMFNKSF